MNKRVAPTELKTTKSNDEGTKRVTISAPRFRTATFKIVGTSPYVQNRFSEKARNKMESDMQAGSQAKSKRTRSARDFEADCKAAMHISTEGWNGIPAGSFRNALISACRIVNFKMTLARLSLFIEADGLDKADGTPLVKIIGTVDPTSYTKPMPVRNATGVIDLRARPRWNKWSVVLRVRWDEDQFSLSDVSNLLMRVGMQVGVGEGRPDSKQSNGLGWGLFEIESK